mmetsp:Transcript_33231/g.61224  ORF Transcript_33231/g.61224 Transcript_33231/m.61224 type:complete len:80 (-) Transcript_33231:208-447(-)
MNFRSHYLATINNGRKFLSPYFLLYSYKIPVFRTGTNITQNQQSPSYPVAIREKKSSSMFLQFNVNKPEITAPGHTQNN